MRSGTDCVRAIAAGLSSAPCICENSSPYLHCHALAAKEAASKIQSTLAEADVLVDAGGRGCRSTCIFHSLAPEQSRGYVAALTAHLPLLRWYGLSPAGQPCLHSLPPRPCLPPPAAVAP